VMADGDRLWVSEAEAIEAIFGDEVKCTERDILWSAVDEDGAEKVYVKLLRPERYPDEAVCVRSSSRALEAALNNYVKYLDGEPDSESVPLASVLLKGVELLSASADSDGRNNSVLWETKDTSGLKKYSELQKQPWDVLLEIASHLKSEDVASLGFTCKDYARKILGWRSQGYGVWRDLGNFRFRPQQNECARAEHGNWDNLGPRQQLRRWREWYIFQERASRLWFYSTRRSDSILSPNWLPVPALQLCSSRQEVLAARGNSLILLKRDVESRMWSIASSTCASPSAITQIVVPRTKRSDGIVAVTAGPNSGFRLWRKNRHSAIHSYINRSQDAFVSALHLEDSYLLSGAMDGAVRVMSIGGSRPSSHTMRPVHTRAVSFLGAGTVKNVALSTSLDCFAKLWDIETRRCLQSLDCHTSIQCAALSRETNLAYLCSGSSIHIWDTRARETAAVLGCPAETLARLCTIAVRNDGLVVAGTFKGEVTAWPVNGSWTGISLPPVERGREAREIDSLHVDHERIIAQSARRVCVYDSSLRLSEYSHTLVECSQPVIESFLVLPEHRELLIGYDYGSICSYSFSDANFVEDEDLREAANLSSSLDHVWTLNSRI